MPRLKNIKQEILRQHRQLALNRRELNLRRMELGQRLRQGLRSKGAMMGTFAVGLLLGWAWNRPSRRGDGPPLSRGLRTLGHWLSPVKGVLWNGLIKTAGNYTVDRFSGSGELREHYDQ